MGTVLKNFGTNLGSLVTGSLCEELARTSPETDPVRGVAPDFARKMCPHAQFMCPETCPKYLAHHRAWGWGVWACFGVLSKIPGRKTTRLSSVLLIWCFGTPFHSDSLWGPRSLRFGHDFYMKLRVASADQHARTLVYCSRSAKLTKPVTLEARHDQTDILYGLGTSKTIFSDRHSHLFTVRILEPKLD